MFTFIADKHASLRTRTCCEEPQRVACPLTYIRLPLLYAIKIYLIYSKFLDIVLVGNTINSSHNIVQR